MATKGEKKLTLKRELKTKYLHRISYWIQPLN